MKKELNQMKSMHVYYEEKYQELISKYEATMKDKMTLKVEKERHLVKLKAQEQNVSTLQGKIKNLLLEKSDRNFDNSVLNESFSGLNQTGLKKNGKSSSWGKENNSVSNQKEMLGNSMGIIKKKTNPLLTKIPDELPNPFLNPNTGIAIETKSQIGMNLSMIKKIKVSKAQD